MEIRNFSDVNINDTFFDSLKEDYESFERWFAEKADEQAFVKYDKDGHLLGFLYLKDESNEVDGIIEPPMEQKRRLKVGTFKVVPHRTRLGEKFIKKIMDNAVYGGYEEAYVTIFPKHASLIQLLKIFGFKRHGTKGDELVLVKDFTTLTGDILYDYPLIHPSGKRKFLLSIYPKYHTPLFSDSILRNEERNNEELIRDVSFSNSIHKIYICFMQDTANLKYGDILVIYRTNDGLGAARYRSVVTSICQVEEVRTKNSFANIEDYINYCKSYSIFSEENLRGWFRNDKMVVIKMTYNIALGKRITRGALIDEAGIPESVYWGFFQLTDGQFKYILEKGNINDEGFIVD